MKPKNEIIASLSQEQIQALVQHFNSIYECRELEEREHNMIYLACMWRNGMVFQHEAGQYLFDEQSAGVSLNDYEISIEDEYSGGVNLKILYEYYMLDKLANLIKC